MSDEVLQSAVVACLSVVLGAGVLAMARRGLLTFRYTIGWLGLLLLGALSSLFIQISQPLSGTLGVTPGVIVLTVGVLVLVVICIQLSISISGLQGSVRRLSEVAAIGVIRGEQTSSDLDVLIIVPAYNEERSVGDVVARLRSFGYPVLVIDDGSRDDTAAVAESAGALVARMPFNAGVGGALRTGLRFAADHGYQTVLQCDADGQHPIDHVQRLLDAAVERDSHLMIGSRFASGDPPSMEISAIRRFAMWTLASSASRAVGRRLTDVSSGFRVFRGSLIPALAQHMPEYYLGDTYEAVISAGRAGYRIEELAVPITERVHGSSSAGSIRATQLTIRAFATAVLRLHVRMPAPAMVSHDRC